MVIIHSTCDPNTCIRLVFLAKGKSAKNIGLQRNAQEDKFLGEPEKADIQICFTDRRLH